MSPQPENLKKLVANELPRDFLLSLAEQMDAAYAAAKREADHTAAERPLYTRRLGQARHFEREEALMRAAQATGLSFIDARPSGYPKVFVETPRLRLAELKVDRWGDLPVDSEERRDLAASNPVVGSFSGQLSCFADPSVSERLLTYVVVVNPESANVEFPSMIGVGIPTANLDDWALLMTVEEALAFQTAETSAPAILPDRAQPRLRVVKKQEDQPE